MRFFTIDEVAEKLRVSRATIVRLLAKGEFPGFQVGSQWRIPEDQLQEYIARGDQWTGQTSDTSESMSETPGRG